MAVSLAPSDQPEPPDDEPWTGEFATDEPAPPGPRVSVTAPALREPRAGIAINGVRLDSRLIDARVTNNRFASADTFSVSLALDETPGTKYGAAWFGDQERLEVEIFAGLGRDAPPSQSLVVGRADDVEINFRRRMVLLTDRDFSADLLETQTTEKWPNRTSSEIATDLAQRHGLEARVTETSRPTGHYYRLEHARLTDATTEWNLLTYLAEQEGFDVFIRGKTLHFGPPPDARSAPRWLLTYDPAKKDRAYPTITAGQLSVRRNLTFAQDIVVRVVSWNPRQKKAFTVTRRTNRGAGRSSSGRFGSSAPHVFRLPGLTEEQAIREAERRLEDLSQRERVIEATGLPADPGLDVRTIVALRGTGSSWDQDYALDEVERWITDGTGFTMRFRARNLAPTSTAAI